MIQMLLAIWLWRFMDDWEDRERERPLETALLLARAPRVVAAWNLLAAEWDEGVNHA